MDDTAQHIITRCQQGDKEAFRWVVQKHQRMVFSLALKMLCDEEEAKDVVQDTMLKAWLNIGSYDHRNALSTWLYTIASRLCLDRLKRMHRIVPVAGDDLVLRRLADDTDHQVEVENREWVAVVRLMAGRLSHKQKWVFTLCELEGLSVAEAEQITGMTAKQVKDNLHVARKKVRRKLTKLGYGPNE